MVIFRDKWEEEFLTDFPYKSDERDRVQKKTFTKWVNKHLMKVRKHVNDLYEDLRDGHNLISLLEVLSGIKLPREKGRMRFHRLQNVQIALDFLKQRQVKLVNIRNDDITDGNPKLTLGLIWTIILHFQAGTRWHCCLKNTCRRNGEGSDCRGAPVKALMPRSFLLLLLFRLPIGRMRQEVPSFLLNIQPPKEGQSGSRTGLPLQVRVASFLLFLVHTPRGDLDAADGGLGSG
ncbi:Microtubule-actin cross-linking factor 1 [Crotalus adamanteus]|uniref:Microtubule-actin cross-linking factor 1 n=1 Tax=Crotalus adamanteus TaxID=8729 RepID=A0AAW1AYQ6_CROAD